MDELDKLEKIIKTKKSVKAPFIFNGETFFSLPLAEKYLKVRIEPEKALDCYLLYQGKVKDNKGTRCFGRGFMNIQTDILEGYLKKANQQIEVEMLDQLPDSMLLPLDSETCLRPMVNKEFCEFGKEICKSAFVESFDFGWVDLVDAVYSFDETKKRLFFSSKQLNEISESEGLLPDRSLLEKAHTVDDIFNDNINLVFIDGLKDFFSETEYELLKTQNTQLSKKLADIESKLLSQFRANTSQTSNDEVAPQGKNALLKMIFDLSETITKGGLTGRHYKDANTVMYEVEKNIKNPKDVRTLSNYLKEIYENGIVDRQYFEDKKKN